MLISFLWTWVVQETDWATEGQAAVPAEAQPHETLQMSLGAVLHVSVRC